jgi:hypothetical protein
VKEYQFSTKYIFIILLAIVYGLILPLYSQSQYLDTCQYNCLLEKDEKVYVQLEKYIYISGEELKYKAYVVNSSKLTKSLQSKVLYFEITGNNSTRVFSWRTNLYKGMCSGSVILPDTISGGIYILRAYTNWMRNTSPDYYNSTRIIITRINESELKQLWIPDPSAEREINSQLPVYSKYYGINIDIDPDQSGSLYVKIRTKFDSPLYNRTLHLITALSGQIIDNIPVTLNDSVVKVEISRRGIPAGILNVVCTDSYYNPVYEKQVYLYPQDYPSLKLNTLKTSYGKKEKVKLELDLSSATLNDTAWLSISVTEKTPFQSVLKNPGILSYMLFSSEIAGHSYIPDSVFSATEISHVNIIETGRNYKYTSGMWQSENNDPCPYIMENKGFVFKGKIVDRDTEEPIINELVILSYTDSITSLKYCFTDSAGNFYFLLDKSYDNKNLILQMIDYKNRNEQIVWLPDNKFCAGLPAKYKPLPVPARAEEYLEYTRQLALVNNTYRLNRQIINLPEIDYNMAERRNFYGSSVNEVYPSDFIELIDFRDISENILPGVKFRKRGGIYFIQIYDHKNKIIMPPEAAVFLNGVPFFDLGYISSLGSKDIKQIDIYSTQLLHGDLSFYGLLSITTYDGKIPDTYLKNYTYIFNNKVQSSVIYDNNYSQLNNNIDNHPDFRQTLHWEPSLTITGQNKAIIEFYTCELKARYNITVQGITASGIPLEATSEIEVK